MEEPFEDHAARHPTGVALSRLNVASCVESKCDRNVAGAPEALLTCARGVDVYAAARVIGPRRLGWIIPLEEGFQLSDRVRPRQREHLQAVDQMLGLGFVEPREQLAVIVSALLRIGHGGAPSHGAAYEV